MSAEQMTTLLSHPVRIAFHKLVPVVLHIEELQQSFSLITVIIPVKPVQLSDKIEKLSSRQLS